MTVIAAMPSARVTVAVTVNARVFDNVRTPYATSRRRSPSQRNDRVSCGTSVDIGGSTAPVAPECQERAPGIIDLNRISDGRSLHQNRRIVFQCAGRGSD